MFDRTESDEDFPRRSIAVICDRATEQEGLMSEIRVRCPQTSSLVSVGIDTDLRSFEAVRTWGHLASEFVCPACGRRHRWSPKDAVLGDLPREAKTDIPTAA
jgi:hypothetical protein